jgi:nucleotide-binding universal stress UspA family protein
MVGDEGMSVIESSVGPSHLVGRADRRRAVVVGFDGSAASRAAAEFAAEEAAADARRLTLLTVLDRIAGVPTSSSREADSQRWVSLLDLRDRITARHPDLEVGVDIQVGNGGERLLERSANQSELVMGSDIRAGSTTMTVVGLSSVPVVVVPEEWRSHPGDPRPVVLGLRPGATDESDGEALRFARSAAERRGVPLRIVTSVGGGPDGTVLLVESAAAQLVVLGRKHDDGFVRPGSVTHTVLRGAGVPVAVVASAA